jgi:hypothetical protein
MILNRVKDNISLMAYSSGHAIAVWINESDEKIKNTISRIGSEEVDLIKHAEIVDYNKIKAVYDLPGI